MDSWSASNNQHSATRHAILPLKSTDFYMDKAKELNATTTHELYEKAPSLELGSHSVSRMARSVCIANARNEATKWSTAKSSATRWVTQNLGQGSL